MGKHGVFAQRRLHAIDYQHYTPTSDWSLLIKDTDNAGRLHWFGPTKAKVSLVVPIPVRTGRRSK